MRGEKRAPLRPILLLVGVVLGGAAACTLVTDLDGLASGEASTPDASRGDTGPVGEGGTGDGGTTTDGATNDAGDGGCRGTAGPKAVRVGSYCIDETEVTARQYQEFLAAKAGDMTGQPSECAGNTSYLPEYDTSGDTPVRAVDWCDAFAYCKWAGKRLCGRIGSGANVPANLRANAASDEWYRACSRDGTRTFPYGSTFDPTACNLPALDAGFAQRPVKSFPKCEGGYPGLFDMAGNLWEWEASCETADGGARSCAQRGGSYASNGPGDCSQPYVVPASSKNDVTIRCCSD